MESGTPWRPPLPWRLQLALAPIVVGAVARLRVTGDLPARLRGGPLILAANHISPFDPIALAAACRVRRIAPRVMAAGGLFRAPVVGAVMRASGHIRVDRGTAAVTDSFDDAARALAAGSVVLVYPEGRIGLDPGMWPERGRTGTARLALATGVPVLPVAQWGTHEVLPYATPKGLPRALALAAARRPVIRVHFGTPIDLGDLRAGVVGHARRATDRIIDGITDALVDLRPDEPDLPRHVDPTRPVDAARARHPPHRHDHT